MKRQVETTLLSKTYLQGEIEVHALSEVSFQVEPGEFLSLHGPSGSGKSTLLNLIGGLDTPSSGSVEIGGTRIDTMSRSERAAFRLHHIGFVFQAYNLIPVFSALENVEFVMQLQGIEKNERRALARQLLAEVGLENLEKRRPGELSGGQQQRVAVARALVGRPALILADEPTANLDSHTAESLIGTMKEMNARHNTTFIFSTHDPLVMRSANRLVQLKDGRIVSDERPGGS